MERVNALISDIENAVHLRETVKFLHNRTLGGLLSLAFPNACSCMKLTVVCCLSMQSASTTTKSSTSAT